MVDSADLKRLEESEEELQELLAEEKLAGVPLLVCPFCAPFLRVLHVGAPLSHATHYSLVRFDL